MRIIAAIATALVACWGLTSLMGAKAVSQTAFNLPVVGWAVTWTVACFVGVGIMVYRSVR